MNPEDHDNLTELKVLMKGLKDDIRELKDSIKTTEKDHEYRIRSLERRSWIIVGGSGMLGAIAGIVVKMLH